MAEVIYLKNGQVVAGKVVSQTRTTMRVQTKTGARTIQKTAIRRVSYSAAEEQRIVRQQEAARRAREEARRQRAEAAQEAARKKAQAEAARETAANQEQETDGVTASDMPSPGGQVWRSAAVPGWGHLARGDTWTGATYLGLSTLALANLITSRGAAMAAESDNGSAVLNNFLITFLPDGLSSAERLSTSIFLNAQAGEPYRAAIHRYTQSLGLMAGIYLIQLGHILYDAFFNTPTATSTAASDDSAGWQFNIAPQIPAERPVSAIRDTLRPAVVEWHGTIGYQLRF